MNRSCKYFQQDTRTSTCHTSDTAAARRSAPLPTPDRLQQTLTYVQHVPVTNYHILTVQVGVARTTQCFAMHPHRRTRQRLRQTQSRRSPKATFERCDCDFLQVYQKKYTNRTRTHVFYQPSSSRTKRAIAQVNHISITPHY